MLLNNEWINDEIKNEIKRYQETIENKNTIAENLWDTSIAVLREKFSPNSRNKNNFK